MLRTSPRDAGESALYVRTTTYGFFFCFGVAIVSILLEVQRAQCIVVGHVVATWRSSDTPSALQ